MSADGQPPNDSGRRAERALPPRIGATVLTQEQQDQAAALLTSEPRPSYASIAGVLGVHWQTIQRLDRKLVAAADAKDSLTGVAAKTEAEYRQQLRKALPVKERVAILREIASGEREVAGKCGCGCGGEVRVKVPAASASDRQKAMQRADELEGVVTAVQRREAEAGGNIVQPLFALPQAHCPGCSCPPGAGRAIGIMGMVSPIRPGDGTPRSASTPPPPGGGPERGPAPAGR